MRRFLTLVCLLCLAVPAGISISGCSRNPGATYCNGLGYGLKDSDVASILMQPQTTGVSLAFGQTQQISSPTGKTCKGAAASARRPAAAGMIAEYAMALLRARHGRAFMCADSETENSPAEDRNQGNDG